MPETETPAPTPTAPKFEKVTLESPIVRGSTTIEVLQIRKPTAGHLRGLQLESLMAGDVNSVIGILPRITVPQIIVEEAEGMDPADLIACAGAIKGFFMSKSEQAMMARFLGIAEAEASKS